MPLDFSSAASGAAAGSAIMPGWGTAIGAGVGLLSGLLNKQKAPKTAPFVPVDPQAEQRKAIAGNAANEQSIEDLLTRSNKYAQGQANSLMEQAMPGYAKLSQKFLALAGSNLDNPYALPKDVSDNLTRLAAERGINTGVRGQAGDFSALRDFGLNSLQYGQSRIAQSQSLLQTIGSLAPRVSPMSPMSFYVTPGQQMQMQQQNNMGQQMTQQAGNNAGAAADNWNTANLWNSVSKAAGVWGSEYDASQTPKK